MWRAEHFSYFMTNMLHSSPDDSPFVNRLKFAELKYVTRSRAAAQSLAENYVGLPFDDAATPEATRLDNALCATL